MDFETEYSPPANFSCHSVGVYRSSFPARKNFSFLKALNLRSILYLCPEEYPETNLKFCDENGIRLMRFPMDGNKEPMDEVPEDIMHSALSALIDVRNHPVLIHCNAGKHRTGAVSGSLRRLQGWSLTSIFQEYNHFAGDKARLADQLFLELYRPVVRVNPRFVAPWFDPHCGVTVVLDKSVEEVLRMHRPKGLAEAVGMSATTKGSSGGGRTANPILAPSDGSKQQTRNDDESAEEETPICFVSNPHHVAT